MLDNINLSDIEKERIKMIVDKESLRCRKAPPVTGGSYMGGYMIFSGYRLKKMN